MKKTISILTGQIAKTQGDISASYKLINAILQANNEVAISINWLIYFTFTEDMTRYYDFYIQYAKSKQVKVICVKHVFEMLQQIREIAQTTDLFILFPATPFRVGNVTCLDSFKKPILIITEYNYKRIFMLDNLDDLPMANFKRIAKCAQVYNSGFGENKLGVLITKNTDLQPQMPFVPVYDIDRRLLLKLTILKAYDEPINSEAINEYKNKQGLFFAYFNAATSIDVHNNNTVNPNFYCEICIRLTLAKFPHKNLDIIVNFTRIAPSIDLNFLTGKYYILQFVDNNMNVVTAITLSNNPALPNIRIFDPFPISNACFTFLLKVSEFFSGLTGDQSLGEGIEQAKLVFYQVMDWKTDIPDGLLYLCAKYIGSESALYKFFCIVMQDNTLILNKFYRFVSSFRELKFDCDAMAKFIIQNETVLLEQMQRFSDAICKYHDLANNLLKIIHHELAITKSNNVKLTI